MATSGPWPVIALWSPPPTLFPYLSFSGSPRSNNLRVGRRTCTTDHTTPISEMSISTSHHNAQMWYICVCVCLGRSVCSSWSVICFGWLIWVMALQIRVTGPCGSYISLEKLHACTHTLPPEKTHTHPSLRPRHSRPTIHCCFTVKVNEASRLLQTNRWSELGRWTSAGWFPWRQRKDGLS